MTTFDLFALLIPIVSNIWVHWVFMPWKIRMIKKFWWFPHTLKPLDCESCMSFWLTAAWFIRCDFFWQGIILAGVGYFIGGLVSSLFTNFLNKYYVKFRRRNKG